MRETKVGKSNIEFTSDTSTNGSTDPYIIGVFSEEACGKTRFPLTGPEIVGFVPFEMKSYVTIEKDAEEFGKKVLKPKDPMSLIVPKRKVDAMTDVEKQKFYIGHVEKAKDTIYGLLEHADVKVVCVDKFTTFCVWQEYATNGMTPKFVKIEGKVYQSKSEVRQNIIDFVNSLSQYGKTVVLNCATKGDYEVLDTQGNPLRNTWDCGAFYMLGSHCNLVVELESNVHWDPKKTGDKYAWHYGLNVRRCQKRPELEGPEGNPLLKDGDVGLVQLIQAVEGERFDMEAWL